MQLYWSSRSPYARKVMATAYECGVADQITCVRTLVSMAQPNIDFLSIHPMGKIPTLVLGDGQVIYDSSIICEYLDTLNPNSTMFPKNGVARWQALQRLAIGNAMLDNLVLWRNEYTRPQSQQSPETLTAFHLKIKSALHNLNKLCTTYNMIEIDIGHITIACALSYLQFRFAALDWHASYTELSKWHQLFKCRPAMQLTEHVDI